MEREGLAGWVIFSGGLVVFVVSVFADQLGIQIIGTLAGVVILTVGAVFALRKRSNSYEPKQNRSTGTSPT